MNEKLKKAELDVKNQLDSLILQNSNNTLVKNYLKRIKQFV
jgi:hypothetical protein